MEERFVRAIYRENWSVGQPLIETLYHRDSSCRSGTGVEGLQEYSLGVLLTVVRGEIIYFFVPYSL